VRRADETAEAADGKPLTFLYVGRLAAEKRVDVIIHAFACARALLPPGSIRLVIAGSGPREAALRAMAPGDTTFLGHLDRERELPRLYASADAFLFASCTETLGLVVLEALASGLPVIATPIGGVAEHLRDGVNGFAVHAHSPVAMAAAIIRLVKEPMTRRRLSRAARESALDLGWEAELDRLDATYRRVLDVGRTRIRA
jgi:glycosyltransferase involved in cell wall biosynthesis